jgi:hypothetical protein
MYRKEVHERSPLRVFERSIHGGLGRGNLGLVLSRAGGGKTAFLIAIAVDDLLRDRKVLHVNTRDAAERVREFYDQVFYDLAESSGMSDRAETYRRIERNRRIHSFLGGTFSLAKLQTALGYMSEHADFTPAAIILDGFPDWGRATEEDLEAVKALAVRYECEVWLSGNVHRDGEEKDARGVPLQIARFDRHLSVIVRLDAEAGHVRLRLVKDHESPEVAALQLELDPSTFLVRWQ